MSTAYCSDVLAVTYQKAKKNKKKVGAHFTAHAKHGCLISNDTSSPGLSTQKRQNSKSHKTTDRQREPGGPKSSCADLEDTNGNCDSGNWNKVSFDPFFASAQAALVVYHPRVVLLLNRGSHSRAHFLAFHFPFAHTSIVRNSNANHWSSGFIENYHFQKQI